jgi:hypothetical protein
LTNRGKKQTREEKKGNHYGLFEKIFCYIASGRKKTMGFEYNTNNNNQKKHTEEDRIKCECMWILLKNCL